MYVEYKPGEKHALTGADQAETPDSFQDAGLLLSDDEVVVDIDHLPKESIKAMISEFNIKTQVVWTDRGAHLYFKKPAWFSRRKDGVCRLGFVIEQHTKNSRPNGMTIKRNGKLREIEHDGARQYMPDIFTVATKKHQYLDLNGFQEGDGRNKGLFQQRKALNNCNNWEKILRFINAYVFAEPMPDDEFNGITRDMEMESDADDKYFVAQQIMNECKTVLYSGSIWWWRDGRYVMDSKNAALIRKVYQRCEGKDTRFIDEIIKQISYRSPYIKSDTVFPIRFRNGFLVDGEFVPTKDFSDFTPFYIDIDYKENATPVKIVDDYINSLASGDENYKKLLMEVIGYVMITDPGRIRSLGKFFMFRGDGANGKGTLLNIMERIYNSENCTNLSIKQLTDDRYRVTMVGKLANLGDDIEPEAINNDQLKVLKNISTADIVSTRRLYAQSESSMFTVKLYFTTNSDIRSFEKGYAFKRRIMWLPMFNKVAKPDPYFISKVTTKEALEYWISLIVDGYKRLYHNEAWTESDIVAEYNEQYHENNNVSLQFAKDLDPDEDIIGNTVNDLRDQFLAWSSDDRKFNSKLFKEAVWDLYQIGIGGKKVNGKSSWVFMRQSETKQQLKH